ncbi:MAG: hypothetical protein ACTSWP_05410 [Candidatus Freyarchaeota archaeon]|nr:hypothetical protein [Candidatus Freyrarchaeum guaymaensis]
MVAVVDKCSGNVLLTSSFEDERDAAILANLLRMFCKLTGENTAIIKFEDGDVIKFTEAKRHLILLRQRLDEDSL